MKSIKDSENTKILEYVESLSTKILDGEKPATRVHFYFSVSHNNHPVRICKSPIENISVFIKMYSFYPSWSISEGSSRMI